MYQQLLQEVGRLDHVAMANMIPWGSRDTKTFAMSLEALEPFLLRRVIEFVDDLNAEIVQALAPKLVFVPLSVARSRALAAVAPLGLSLSQAQDLTAQAFRSPRDDSTSTPESANADERPSGQCSFATRHHCSCPSIRGAV